MSYFELSKDSISHLYQICANLKNLSIDTMMVALIQLRDSQFNNYSYCCDFPLKQARAHEISQNKSDQFH